jgi:hypothetical protein
MYIISQIEAFMVNVSQKKGEWKMKKLMLLAVAAIMACAIAGCGSLRTPKNGERSKWVYYNTFFGLSIESGVYGDGFIVK